MEEKKLKEERDAEYIPIVPKEIPAEVANPLYDSIVAANEARRAETKANSVAMTKAREAPFNFYLRDLAKAPPAAPPAPQAYNFRANPIPMTTKEKKYERMCFEEALTRKERIGKAAAQSLAQSKMPARMEMAQKQKFEQSIEAQNTTTSTMRSQSKSKVRKVPDFDALQYQFSQQMESCKQSRKQTKPQPFKFNESKKTSGGREYMDDADIKEKWEIRNRQFTGKCLKPPSIMPSTTQKTKDWIAYNQSRAEERLEKEQAKENDKRAREQKLESMRTRVHNCPTIKDNTAAREAEIANRVVHKQRQLAKAEKEYKDTLALINESVRNRPLMVEEVGKSKHYLPEEESDIFVQEDFLEDEEP